jgi:hypothetical protein
MVTGKRAFTGATQASVIASILKDTPPAASTLQPVSPPILDGTIATCLAKSPDDRWQTAGDVGRQLKLIQTSAASGSVARGSMISDIAIPPAKSSWKRWVAVLVAVATVAVALALAIPVFLRAPGPAATASPLHSHYSGRAESCLVGCLTGWALHRICCRLAVH